MAGMPNHGQAIVDLIRGVPGIENRFGERPRWLPLLEHEINLWLAGTELLATEMRAIYAEDHGELTGLKLVAFTDQSVLVLHGRYQHEGASGWHRPTLEIAPLTEIGSLTLEAKHLPSGLVAAALSAKFTGIEKPVQYPAREIFEQDNDEFGVVFRTLRDAYFNVRGRRS